MQQSFFESFQIDDYVITLTNEEPSFDIQVNQTVDEFIENFAMNCKQESQKEDNIGLRHKYPIHKQEKKDKKDDMKLKISSFIGIDSDLAINCFIKEKEPSFSVMCPASVYSSFKNKKDHTLKADVYLDSYSVLLVDKYLFRTGRNRRNNDEQQTNDH